MAYPNTQQINNSYMIDPNEELYNIEGKTGEVDVEAFAGDDNDDKKSSLKSGDYIPSGSATVDLSEEQQVNSLIRYDATTGEAYTNDYGQMADIYKGITSDLSDMRRGGGGSNRYEGGTGSPESFDNVNSDNYKADTGSILGTAKNLTGKAFGLYSLDKGPEGAFISGMLGSMIGGGFPFATAAVWMAYGHQQKKDKNNFIKSLGDDGMSSLLSDPDKAYPYAGKNDKNASQYMKHILYNSFNPGYALKKHADIGTSPKEALANFMNEGIDNGVFEQASILKMGSSRHDFRPGSDNYMKAWAAEKALKDKGWEGRGRLWTDTLGVSTGGAGSQWLDGKLWKAAPTPVQQTTDSGSGGTSGSGGVSFDDNQGYNFSSQDANTDSSSQTYTQDNYEQASGTGSSGSSKGSGPSRSQQRVSKPSSTPLYGPRAQDRKLGGTVRLQEGGTPEEAMMAQMQNQPVVEDTGNLEMVNEPNKDMSGIADDVPRKLEEGDFVINAPAVEMAGRGDIERMVTKAISELQRKGTKIDFGTSEQDIDSMVDALVSNGEMIIPKSLAEQIGYDRLEKINNRGKERVEAKEQEKEQIQQNPTQPNPQQGMGMMAVGGQVTLDENKNQPIAVPQEGFAGQSSVGNKLLSPMSPEAQDDEKELANKSQSFEGFMKPIKLAEGDKVQQNPTRADRNNNPFNMESNVNTNKFFGSIGNDIENLSVDMPKNGFLKFDTFDNGLRAGAYILRKQYNNMNADEIMKTFSLTDKASYAQAIKNTFGNNKINTQDDNQLLELLKIITNQEGTEQKINEGQFKNAIERAKKEEPNATWSTQGIKNQLTNTINPSLMMGK